MSELTLSGIENWSTAHLDQAAEKWPQLGKHSTQIASDHRDNLSTPAGTEWRGASHQAAFESADYHAMRVTAQASLIDEAGAIAKTGSADVQAMRQLVLEAVNEARQDGFRVNQDLSVTDTKPHPRQTAARTQARQGHAEFIRWRAAQLVATDDGVNSQLQAKAAEIHGSVQSPQVHAVDFRTDTPQDPKLPGPQNAQDVKDYLSGLDKGNNTRIKLVPNDPELRTVFDRLTGAATQYEQQGPIQWRVLPDGTRVGITSESKTGGGDTIRVDYPGEPRNGTVHVDPSARSIYEPKPSGGGGIPIESGGGRGGGAATPAAPPSPAPEPIKPGEGGLRFGGGGTLIGPPEQNSQPGHGLEIYPAEPGPFGGGKIGEVDGKHHDE